MDRDKQGYVPENERSSGFQSSGRGTYIGDMQDPEVTKDPPPGGSPFGPLGNFTDNITHTMHKEIINATTSDPVGATSDILSQYGMGVSQQWEYPCEMNDSLCFFNMSYGNETMNDGPPEYRFWAIMLIVIPIFTVFGNILVVMSVYRERSLRTVTNYFICSLAVADIFVAVLVMPFAVYMEVTGAWLFSDPLCDAWVASDVMACTASILNLTAISVDRFIAVTQPIKYSKHKNSKRIFVMLALTWVISVAIAVPIALGVNYSEKRAPGDCAFFNSDFLIYSSMGSFYIPSLIMIFLYWRIYRVLHIRSQRALAQKKKLKTDQKAIRSVIENTAATAPCAEPTVTTGLARVDNGKPASYNTNKAHKLATPVVDDTSVTNMGTGSDSQGENDDSNMNDGSDTKSPASDDNVTQHDGVGELIANPVAQALDKQETAGNSATTSGNNAEAETKFNSPGAPRCAQLSPLHTKGSVKSDENRNKEAHKKGITKFNFHMRTSRKRKERSSSKRERKATKTLAIVLGVFLLCWWPFFTINIVNAICIKFDLFEYAACNMPVVLFSFFVWLGYINSFLNPVIYTIFNPEFRKAFKKILSERCK
ncbi:dopamine D2-like receptor [Patella vulgata]|uniref:dopamine D2-like receptor n=1 Tax=Patella vulgata TaxID=6465 RepID=UPI00218098D4|nr:dopamine D2-like receptor [Patella vulgata]